MSKELLLIEDKIGNFCCAIIYLGQSTSWDVGYRRKCWKRFVQKWGQLKRYENKL